MQEESVKPTFVLAIVFFIIGMIAILTAVQASHLHNIVILKISLLIGIVYNVIGQVFLTISRIN
jgi:type III secretory pathway component EscS